MQLANRFKKKKTISSYHSIIFSQVPRTNLYWQRYDCGYFVGWRYSWQFPKMILLWLPCICLWKHTGSLRSCSVKTQPSPTRAAFNTEGHKRTFPRFLWVKTILSDPVTIFYSYQKWHTWVISSKPLFLNSDCKLVISISATFSSSNLFSLCM